MGKNKDSELKTNQPLTADNRGDANTSESAWGGIWIAAIMVVLLIFIVVFGMNSDK